MTVSMDDTLIAVWKKHMPTTRERLALLQTAADDLARSRTIADDERAEALSTAHKFAGSLGMFGMHEASEIARAMEQHLQQDGLPQPERLQEQVAALAALLAPHLQD